MISNFGLEVFFGSLKKIIFFENIDSIGAKMIFILRRIFFLQKKGNKIIRFYKLKKLLVSCIKDAIC